MRRTWETLWRSPIGESDDVGNTMKPTRNRECPGKHFAKHCFTLFRIFDSFFDPLLQFQICGSEQGFSCWRVRFWRRWFAVSWWYVPTRKATLRLLGQYVAWHLKGERKDMARHCSGISEGIRRGTVAWLTPQLKSRAFRRGKGCWLVGTAGRVLISHQQLVRRRSSFYRVCW